MAGKYVSIDASELRKFVEKMEKAGRGGEFKKELIRFLDSLGVEFLSKVQDFIINAESVDTRRLIESFEKGHKDNIFCDDRLNLEVGSNVEYASYVNDGHHTSPKYVAPRFIKGSHYFDDAVRHMEKDVIPKAMEEKMQEWLEKYFSDFL